MVWPHWKLIFITSIVSFCSNWQFAFQITYVNTSVNTFYDLANQGFRAGHDCQFCWLPKQSWSSAWSTIVSSFYPGTILGFLVTPLFTSRLGVKRTQIIMCISAICGCIVQVFTELTVEKSAGAVSLTLILGRFLIGIQAGSSLCLLPLYVMEVSPSKHRAFLSTFQQVSQALGTLLGLVIGSENIVPLGDNRFLWLQVFAVAPTLLFVVVLLLTPKTPHQLVRERAQTIDVIDSISYYHGVTSHLSMVRDECMIIQEKPRKSELLDDSSPPSMSDCKGFLIGSAAAISYAFTADDLVDTFSSQILEKASPSRFGVSSTTADTVSVALGAILLIASIFGSFLIDRFGRRRLLIFGLLGTTLSNMFVVLFPSSFIIVTLGFALTKTFIGLGAGAPAWFLTSELVSPYRVSLYQSLSTGLLLTSTMLVTFFYLQLDMLIGSWSMLVLASGPSLLLAFLLYLFLPETKDRTNTEVQSLLHHSTLSGLEEKRRNSPMYGTL